MIRKLNTDISSLRSGDIIKVPGFSGRWTVNSTAVVMYRSGDGRANETRSYIDFVEENTSPLVAPPSFKVELEVKTMDQGR